MVNIGAIAIERGSLFEATFNAIGVPLDVREPNPATVFRIDGKIINIFKGGGWACCSAPSPSRPCGHLDIAPSAKSA